MYQPTQIQIGVYMQPPANFARVRGYGCNCIITDKSKPDSPPETPISRFDYFKKANDNGLKLIIGAAAPDPAADIGRPGMFGWCQPDEADRGNVADANGWSAKAEDYIKHYAALKAVDPTVPVFGNFSGGRVLSARLAGGNPTEPLQSHYKLFSDGTDMWGADKYIRARGEPSERIADYGRVQDKLKLIAPGKPTFAVIETCDQGLKGTTNPPANPTPEEVMAMAWLSIIHGAQSLFYFTLIPTGGTKPFSWDNTPPDVAAALPGINAEVMKYEKLILGGVRIINVGESSNGSRIEQAIWTHADGSRLDAKVTLDAMAKKWATTIVGNIVQPVPVDPEKEAMRARLKKIDDWKAAFPA